MVPPGLREASPRGVPRPSACYSSCTPSMASPRSDSSCCMSSCPTPSPSSTSSSLTSSFSASSSSPARSSVGSSGAMRPPDAVGGGSGRSPTLPYHPHRMQTPRVSPAAYRRLTAVVTVAVAFIIVTGGAVRITGSGLGCPDWPTCAQDRLVAPWEYHAMVEFVNRTVTGLVSVAVIVAVLASLLRRPRRRDLTWLSLGLVGGVVAQIVLGGLTVLFELKPGFVMAHFLLSLVLLADAVVLHHRARLPDGRAGGPGGPPT